MENQELKQNFGEAKKRFILLNFTKELIIHSDGEEILKLENILKKQLEKKDKKKIEGQKLTKIFKKIKNPEEELIESLDTRPSLHPNQLKFPQKHQQRIPEFIPTLTIPMPKLPPRFQYLRPTPTKLEIDLKKLNPLIKDPLVKNIESNGPNENVIVEGTMGRKKTPVVLDRKEIDEVIDKFSKASKIPTYEGVFRVVVGKLIFSAIISEAVGSKFIIRKIVYNPRFR